MKKLFTVAILLTAMAVAAPLFAAGSQQQAATAEPLAEVSPNGQTVIFWHNHSGSREQGLNEMIARFNRENEWGVTVNAEYGGGYGDIYNKMITGLAGGQVPHLVVAYQNQAAGYQVADGLVDLTSYVDHPEWGISDTDDFFSGFFNQDVNAQFDNQRLGFPPNRSAEVLYYNRTWLEELGFSRPPTTWDEFEQMVVAATNPAAGTYGYAIRTDASNVYAMAISRGGEFQAPGGAGYQLDTPEVRASMEVMKRLYDGGYARKIAERFADQGDFGNRRVLFTMGSTSGIPFYQQAVDAGTAGTFEWSVAAIPHTTPRAQTNIYGASASIPRTTSEAQLAAWLFIRWFSAPEQQAEWVRISNYFPVRSSVADGLGEYFVQNPRYEDAFRILQTGETKAEPPFAGYDEVRDLIAASYNAIIDGASISRTLELLERQANEVHRIASPD